MHIYLSIVVVFVVVVVIIITETKIIKVVKNWKGNFAQLEYHTTKIRDFL